MPLAQVLSALREIILDEIELPGAYESRKKFIGQRFSGLSENEILDLSQISPEKFSVYSGTIFRGETNTLQLHFPITIALLSQHWNAVFGDTLDLLRFTKDVHRKFPWRGNTTLALMESVQSYIKTELQSISDIAPAIEDAVVLEIASLAVKRALDFKPKRPLLFDLENVASISVEEFLALEFVIPPSTVFKQFDYDVVFLRKYFYTHSQTIPESGVTKDLILGVGGRTRELNVRWGYAPREMFACLSSVAVGESSRLEMLAEAYVGSLADELTEAEQFQKFVTFVVGLIETGAIMIYKNR